MCKGVKKIYVDNKFKLNENIKHNPDILLYILIKTYVYKYPYFTYKVDTSTIHQNHIKKYHIPYKKIVNKLVKTRK